MNRLTFAYILRNLLISDILLMKNLIFTLLFVLSAVLTVQAQTFSLSADTAWVAGPINIDDIETHIDIVNLINSARDIKWERTELVLNPVGMPISDLYTQVCDANACWGGATSTKTFVLDAGATVPMIVHLRNFTAQAANAVVQLKFTDLAFPDNPQFAYYFLDASLTGTHDLPAADVQLFPNPVVESFTLTNSEDVARVRVFNTDGRLVLDAAAQPGNVYMLKDQPAGSYAVVLAAQNGKTFQVIPIVKN